MKAIEQYMYFHVVLFIMLYKVVLNLRLKINHVYDHSNESTRARLKCDTVYHAVLSGSNYSTPFAHVCVTIQMKAIEQCFDVVLFIMMYKVVILKLFVIPVFSF